MPFSKTELLEVRFVTIHDNEALSDNLYQRIPKCGVEWNTLTHAEEDTFTWIYRDLWQLFPSSSYQRDKFVCDWYDERDAARQYFREPDYNWAVLLNAIKEKDWPKALLFAHCYALPEDVTLEKRAETLSSIYESMGYHLVANRIRAWVQRRGRENPEIGDGVLVRLRGEGLCQILHFDIPLSGSSERVVVYRSLGDGAVNAREKDVFMALVESVLKDSPEDE